MSSKKYAAPLRLEPERSRRLAMMLAVSVAGAALLPLTLAVPLLVRALVWPTIAAIAFRIYRHHLGTERIVRAVWDELGQWQLRLANGTEWEVQLEGDSFVTPEVMILNFKAERRRFHLVVLADVFDPDTLRRLRVRLRLDGVPSQTDSASDLSDTGK